MNVGAFTKVYPSSQHGFSEILHLCPFSTLFVTVKENFNGFTYWWQKLGPKLDATNIRLGAYYPEQERKNNS